MARKVLKLFHTDILWVCLTVLTAPWPLGPWLTLFSENIERDFSHLPTPPLPFKKEFHVGNLYAHVMQFHVLR